MLMEEVFELTEVIKGSFLEHLSNVTCDVTHDFYDELRVDDIDEKVRKEVASGKRIDIRPIKMMLLSGKGNAQHKDTLNISLFDHSIGVAFGALRLAATDIGDEVEDEAALERLLRQLVVVGFAHDIDKYFQLAWRDLSVADASKFMAEWRLAKWLDEVGVAMSPEQLYGYIQAAEVRSSFEIASVGLKTNLVEAVRRYVRAADEMESYYAKNWRVSQLKNITDKWDKIRKTMVSNPSKFGAYEPVIITESHHLFLLNAFHDILVGTVNEKTKCPPLFSTVCDGTMITYVPVAEKQAILDEAVKNFIFYITEEILKTNIVLSAQGLIKITGPVPFDYDSLENLMTNYLLLAEGHKIFGVRTADFAQKDVFWKQFQALASSAGCEVVDQVSNTPTTYIVRSVAADYQNFDDVVRAAMIAFLIGVEQPSKNKAWTYGNREKAILEIIGLDIEEPVGIDKYTRRTWVALTIASHLKSRGEDGIDLLKIIARNFLSDVGVFNFYEDKLGKIPKVLDRYFRSRINGESVDEGVGDYRCIITGEKVDDTWKVTATDGLHNIKSSAISYREGRAEEKFKEIANAHISPVAFAESRLRGINIVASHAKGTPVKVTSHEAQGFFGAHYTKTRAHEIRQAEVTSYDVARQQTNNVTVRPIDSYRWPMKFARFEDLKSTFFERVDLFSRMLTMCMRLGRPIHVFSGLPHAVPEFFYADCLGRDLEALLGGPGIRIEGLGEAKRNIELVAYMAKPRSEGGLGSPELAKDFCFPHLRLRSAILAWWTAEREDSPDASRVARYLFNALIPKEVQMMQSKGQNMPELKLAEIARTFQRGPKFDESTSFIEFVPRLALEEAEKLYANGRRGEECRDLYVAVIAEEIRKQAERRSGSDNFYAAGKARTEGQTIDKQIDLASAIFVDEIWYGLFGGRPCKHADKRQLLSAYTYAFKKITV